MAQVRRPYIEDTHRTLFESVPDLNTLETSFKRYVAQFGIQHGVLKDLVLEAQQSILDMGTLLSRISILGEQSASILFDDVAMVRHLENAWSNDIRALQELIGRYQTHLTTSDLATEDVWMQIFLEQAINSPITERALTHWLQTQPNKKRFLQIDIPSLWIQTPVVFQTLSRGVDILPHPFGMLILSEFNIQYFDFRTARATQVFSLPNDYYSRNRIIQMVQLDGQQILITTEGLWCFTEPQPCVFNVEFIQSVPINRCEIRQSEIYLKTDDGWCHLFNDCSLNLVQSDLAKQLNLYQRLESTTIELEEAQIEISQPNFGLIQLKNPDKTIYIESNGEQIHTHLHHGGFLGLVSKLDVVIIDVSKLLKLSSNPIGNNLSLLYGSVQFYDKLLTITGTLPMNEQFILYWTYQGVFGHRTNIEICVYDTHAMEEIYCENSQDLDDVEEVVLFESDCYGEDDVPFIVWVISGHRSVIIDFDDIPMFAPMSPYASSAWPYRPDGLEELEPWSGNMIYEVTKTFSHHTIAQNNIVIGTHLMPFPTSWVSTLDNGDLIFCSSAKIFHVRPFTAHAYQQHLQQCNTLSMNDTPMS